MGQVGRIALTVTGTVVGAYFGMPGLGTMAGSLLGGLIFPGGGGAGQTAEGPRLTDLTVTSSAYGNSITELWGTMRLNGNVLWSDGIKEHKHTTKVKPQGGGKGMGSAPSQKQVTYTYTCSFAVGLCQGEANKVLRIWADTKLIYDVTGENKLDISVDDLDFRFYTGSETQMPDPHVMAKIGDDAPAYRGLCYIMFEDLPLEDFANRIPNITVEVSKDVVLNPTFIPFEKKGDEVVVNSGSNGFRNLMVDDARGRVFATYHIEDIDRVRMVCYNLYTGFRYWERTMPEFYEGLLWAITSSGHVITTISDGPGELYEILALIDGGTGETLDTIHLPVDINIAPSNAFFFNGPDSLPNVVVMAWLHKVTFIQTRDNELVILDTDDTGELAEPIVAIAKENDIKGYALTAHNDGPFEFNIDTVSIYEITMKEGNSGPNLDLSKKVTMNVTDLFPGIASCKSGDVGSLYYDASDDTLIFCVRETPTVDNRFGREMIIKYDPDNDELIWRTLSPENLSLGAPTQHSLQLQGVDQPRNAQFVQMGNTKGYFRVSDGVYFSQTEIPGAEITSNNVLQPTNWPPRYYNGNANWAVTHIKTEEAHPNDIKYATLFFNGAVRGESTVGQVIRDVAERSGLNPVTDLDLGDVDALALPGYAVARPTTARDIISPLQQIYLFDGFESDFLLKFRSRGQEPVRDLTQGNILRSEDSLDFTETRIQETELPVSMSMTFASPSRDYQEQTFTAKRISNPVSTMWSNNKATLSVPAAFSDNFVKQQVEKLLYSAWVARSNYDVSFDWSQIDLDPSDVINMTMDDGTLYRMRFTNFDIGADLTVQAKSVSEDDAQYVSDVEADGGEFPGQSIPPSGPTRLIVLDTVLLRDDDDTGGASSRFYLTMSGYGQPAWNAGVAYGGADQDNLDLIGSVVSEGTWGTVVTAIPNTSTPWLTDYSTVITINLATNIDQGLNNASYKDMLAGVNAAAILRLDGKAEIIQFGSATEVAPGQWQISTLFRGRRGSEVFCAGHQSGETFVLLDSLAMDLSTVTPSQIGTTMYFRGVQSGKQIASSELLPHVMSGDDLRPYAPVYVKAMNVAGDIEISWLRRTRIGDDLYNGDEIPLGESIEEYEVDVFNGVTKVRTLSSDVHNVTYTAADIATDFGTTPVSLHVVVYQMSSVVGRGFGQDVTIEVQP